ncbi:hypothetical protein ACQKNX_03610 [Lysinibacillus sp. NPDC093712]|uniref:hypothetical protein n=1 Tax=Lysinibacillus sp. NPDC093712 TaxID=3390579 RepID=UPI003D08E0F7
MKSKKLFLTVVSAFIVLIIVTTILNLPKNQEESKKDKLPNKETIDEIPNVNTNGNYISYANLETLEQNSELIIIAQATQNFEDREHINTFYETPKDKYQPEFLIEGITKTDVNIKKILKQPENEHYNEEEIISVIEPITIFEDVGKVKKVKTISNYKEIGRDDYILFLKKNTYGDYGIINMNNGRYNLNNTNELNTSKALSSWEERERNEDLIIHHEIIETIFEKYSAEIKEIQNQ